MVLLDTVPSETSVLLVVSPDTARADFRARVNAEKAAATLTTPRWHDRSKTIHMSSSETAGVEARTCQTRGSDAASAPGSCMADLRSLLRLMGELPATNADALECRRHLLDGLTRILPADTWAWSWSPDACGGIQRLQHGYFTSEEAARLPSMLEGRDASPLALGIMHLARRGRATTTTLRTLLASSDELAINDSVQTLPAVGSSGDVLLSWLPSPSGGYSCLWFCRRESGKPFTAREEHLVHLAFNEIAWLHGQSCRPTSRGSSRAALPPRAQMVLTLLLDGKVAKEIAQTLGISTRTVREHIERIYRHFGVDGRPGLHRHFRFGVPSRDAAAIPGVAARHVGARRAGRSDST